MRVVFVLVELEAFMRTLNIGLDLEKDHEHEHQEDVHTDHDHSGARRRTRHSHEHQEGNSTWDQVCKTVQKTTDEADFYHFEFNISAYYNVTFSLIV